MISLFLKLSFTSSTLFLLNRYFSANYILGYHSESACVILSLGAHLNSDSSSL